MNYGIERTRLDPQQARFGVKTAAQEFGVSVDELEVYSREGLLISLQDGGAPIYTARDHQWIATVRSLVRDAHLSFDEIRYLLSRCPCWKYRHCDFCDKYACPLNRDPSKPCWINRQMCTVLSSYPCYFCIVYRSAPECEALRAMLGDHVVSTASAYGYYGG